MIKLSNEFKIDGLVRVYRLVNDQRVFVSEFCNIVTTAYRNRMLNKILSSADASQIVPVKMAWGTGLTAASAADSVIEIPLLEKTINNTPVISGSSIIYEGRLNATEANTTIKEVGLKTSDNLLVARVNVSVPKTSLDIFIFQWTHTVTGV